MTTNDGGPAFPVVAEGGIDSGLHAELHYGLTIRDWFAGQALAGIMSGLHLIKPSVGGEDVARVAYSAADAMISHRSKP